VRVSEYGHSVEWINDKDQEIDFGADSLRAKAENQARLNEVAAVLQY
jgi:outer membrane protein OmpA-like peptidoglycan-associated protein